MRRNAVGSFWLLSKPLKTFLRCGVMPAGFLYFFQSTTAVGTPIATRGRIMISPESQATFSPDNPETRPLLLEKPFPCFTSRHLVQLQCGLPHDTGLFGP